MQSDKKKDEKKEFLKKGERSQKQFASNQIVQTIQEQALNNSINETKNSGYKQENYDGKYDKLDSNDEY